MGELCLVDGSFFSSPTTASFEGVVLKIDGIIVANALSTPNVVPSGQLNLNQTGIINLKFNNLGNCEITNAPIKLLSSTSVFIGRWTGGTADNAVTCNGATFVLDILVESNGDPTCQNTLCVVNSLVSTINEGVPNFPVIQANLVGTMSHQGDLTLGLSPNPIPNPTNAIFLASGAANQNQISGNFTATPSGPGCSGVFGITKMN